MKPNTPRAATQSKQAKNALAVAVAEGKEDAKGKQQAPKKRGRPKKKPEPEPEPTPPASPEPDELEEEEEVQIVADIDDIDWKDEDGIKLTWQLITAIEGADETRASLFPPVGANKISGGRKKSEYQFDLAKKLFAEHPKYKDAFATIATAKDKKFWYSKIKNRLDALIKKVRAQIEEMGQTGAGVENEEDIMPGTALTTKWDLIKKDSPWFFHMRSLVGERPNLVHAGLGNNDSEVDMGILLSSRDHDLDDSSSLAADDAADLRTRSPSAAVSGVDPDGSDSDFAPAPTLASVKQKEKVAGKRKQPSGVESSGSLDIKPALKKTKPMTGISQPAAKKVSTTKPATIKDKFVATALAEEETAQQLLKLKQSKHEARKEVQLEKL
ncbi:hypothetical protein B0H16DRAFT_1895976 [Mycena metata]|nr:hypothetical protein B0H16DRAFT_1895976 [Mycena metata]